MLIILTAVEKVAVNFGKENEEWLDDITVDDAKKYINEGQFAPGSMLPKVQAAVDFASSKEGRTAMITLLQKAKDGIQGKTGTKIHLLICSADILLYISCLILIYITATYSGYLLYSEIIAQKKVPVTSPGTFFVMSGPECLENHPAICTPHFSVYFDIHLAESIFSDTL